MENILSDYQYDLYDNLHTVSMRQRCGNVFLILFWNGSRLKHDGVQRLCKIRGLAKP
jgi:hypothetical protein